MLKYLLASISLLSIGWCASAPSPPSFFARRYYQGYSFELVADVNGDGFPDIIATDGSSGQVMLGDGKGDFTMLQVGPFGLSSGSPYPPAAVADMNGDGRLDLVVVGTSTPGFTPAGVGVCVGNGDGTFQRAVFYQAGEDQVGGVMVGDFNGDGIPDVVTYGSSGIWLFTGKGNGTLNPGVLTPVASTLPNSAASAAADFNGDGYLDIAVVTPSGFAVLLGNGNGTFHTPRYLNTSTPEGWMVAGDTNLDGHPDLVFTPVNTKVNHLEIYVGDGTGNFTGPVNVSMPTQGAGTPYIAIGDVNGDGIPDLVDGAGFIAYGRGDGTFRKPVYHPVGEFGGNPVLADLRNSGHTDIVAGDMSILLSWGKGRFEVGGHEPVADAGSCAAPADYNMDGRPDLAISTRAGGIAMLLGTGNPLKPFKVRQAFSLAGADCAVAGDVNGDGIPDLLVPVYNDKTRGGKIYAYLGRGDGTFRRKGYTTIPAHLAGDLTVGDFNHDGKLDFALSTNLLALGKGDGTFGKPAPFMPNPPAVLASQILTGDLNGDGWPDLVVAGQGQPNVDILLNNQAGGFSQTEVTGEGCSAPVWVSLGDLNSDGNLDMVVSWSSFCETCGKPCPDVFLGDGKGGFQGIETPALHGAITVIGDVNGDGIPDIVGTGLVSFAIALGNGDGTFNYPACLGSITIPLSEQAQGSLCLGAGPQTGYWYLMNLFGQPASAGVPDIVVPDLSGSVWALYNTTKH